MKEYYRVYPLLYGGYTLIKYDKDAYSGSTYNYEIKNIIAVEKEDVIHRPFQRELNVPYTVYEPVAMVCEKLDDGSYIDVVCGKVYDSEIINKYADKLSVKIANKMSSQAVVDYLKKFSREDIARYIKAINQLDEEAKMGYNRMKSFDENKKVQEKRNEDFITKFRNNNTTGQERGK